MNTGIKAMDERSKRELDTVKPALRDLIVSFMKSPLCSWLFIVTDGVRSLEEQEDLFKRGASWTLKSKHLTRDAVDICILVNGKARWELPLYVAFMRALKAHASIQGVKIKCGVDWQKRDGPHVELA